MITINEYIKLYNIQPEAVQEIDNFCKRNYVHYNNNGIPISVTFLGDTKYRLFNFLIDQRSFLFKEYKEIYKYIFRTTEDFLLSYRKFDFLILYIIEHRDYDFAKFIIDNDDKNLHEPCKDLIYSRICMKIIQDIQNKSNYNESNDFLNFIINKYNINQSDKFKNKIITLLIQNL